MSEEQIVWVDNDTIHADTAKMEVGCHYRIQWLGAWYRVVLNNHHLRVYHETCLF
jgi:hypothetical protein